MSKYRKKPIVIEAVQFTEETKNQVFHWVTCNHYPRTDEQGKPTLLIETLEGDMTAVLGDWIIKGVKGEFYPCKPDIFEKTYELVGEMRATRIEMGIKVPAEFVYRLNAMEHAGSQDNPAEHDYAAKRKRVFEFVADERLATAREIAEFLRKESASTLADLVLEKFGAK